MKTAFVVLIEDTGCKCTDKQGHKGCKCIGKRALCVLDYQYFVHYKIDMVVTGDEKVINLCIDMSMFYFLPLG